MTDPVFAPAPKPAGMTVAGGAELVFLREVLFVIRGVYHHPLTDAEAPLPPHRWALVDEAAQRFVEGPTSDADGLSTILRTDLGTAAGRWALWLIPIFDDQLDTTEVAERGEAWIDVDINRWVRPSGRGNVAEIEPRRLLRIPRWSSDRKAASGGGFREGFPGAASFETTGLLETSQIVPHGTRDAPWTIAIDHGWLRTFVQLRYYDATRKQDLALPQGITLEALATDPDPFADRVRVGASSVRRDDGSIYVLHARDEASSGNVDYLWQTMPYTAVLYRTNTYETSPDAVRDTAQREEEYELPVVWHSFGTQAWEGPEASSNERRRAFTEIRTAGQTAEVPLCFHLDDVVLTHNVTRRPIRLDPERQHLAIYTTLAELRDPQKTDDGSPMPYSTLRVRRFPLHAEAAAIRRGRGFEWQTLFFEHEGDLYVLDNQFVEGQIGRNPHVGTRAATLAAPIDNTLSGVSGAAREEKTGRYRLYLIDARWVRIPYQGASTRLAHLVCYVSAFIDGDQLHNSNKDAIVLVKTGLYEAMTLLDQKHPGIDDSSLTKHYVVIPEAGLTDGSTLVKIRHVFGIRSTRDLPSPLPGGPRVPLPIVIQIDTQPGRATAGEILRLYCQRGDATHLPPDPAAIDNGAKPAPRPYAFEELPGDARTDPFDETTFAHSTLFHELGHESGLVDEYVNDLDVGHPDADQSIPRFTQDYRALPYDLDGQALMKSDRVPRLRYTFHYVDSLHQRIKYVDDAHWLRREAPFLAQYKGKARTLRHRFGRDPGTFATLLGGPWTPTPGTHNLCDLTFYPTSEDEGTVGPMFGADHVKTKSFDGLLVVHPMIWVRFDPAVTGLLKQWRMFAIWAERYSYSRWTLRFAIETAGVTLAKRVAIVLQPRFEFDPKPHDASKRGLATLELLLHQRKEKPRVHAGSPPVLEVREKDVGNWILRYAINQPAKLEVSHEATTASDLSQLAGALATMLGRPEVGKVVEFP